MKILITGLNGYLGSLISNELGKQGHQVSGISRSLLYGSVSELSVAIKSADVVINLAGAPILQRWTKKNKEEIHNSRFKTTTNLVEAINQLAHNDQPKKFISASAIGIYKTGLVHSEDSINFDEGFVGTVVRDWEKPLQNLPVGTRKIVFRIGLVIGKNAKTIKKQLLPFKLGLGAKIGSGHQPFPFIHEKDVVQAFVWAVEKYEDNNIFNLVAPENINNKEFTTAFARQLNRPAFFSIPEFAIKLVLGKASVLLTQSPQVLSGKIQKAGFRFKYPGISSALQEIIG